MQTLRARSMNDVGAQVSPDSELIKWQGPLRCVGRGAVEQEADMGAKLGITRSPGVFGNRRSLSRVYHPS